MTYNGNTYYYALNLQGDVMALLDSSGNEVVSYHYNAWGKLLNTTASTTGMLYSLALYNPLRYRGYVYDRETGLYYLQSRYYNPEICRFISADDIDLLGANGDVVSYNLFAYCSNNPMMRKDNNGHLWTALAKIGAGLLSQYVSDIIVNVISGETGWDVLKPRSSFGEYVAAGLTALVPGSDLGAAIFRSFSTEAIKCVETYVTGDDINWGDAAFSVVSETLMDFGFSKASDFATNNILFSGSRNYSSTAGKMRKKNPNVSRDQICSKMRFSGKVRHYASAGAQFGIDVTENLVSRIWG